MIETNIKSLNIDELIQTIKNKIKDQKNSNIKDNIFNITNKELNFVNINQDVFIEKSVYEYPDFTKYNDIDFIKNIYKGILKREADEEGFNFFLSMLRSGDKTKNEIISILRYSKEGKKINIKLLGSLKRFFLLKLYSFPFLGYISKLIVSFLTLPNLLKKINRNEAYISKLEDLLLNNDLKLEKEINNKIDLQNFNELFKQLNLKKADKTELDFKVDKIDLESRLSKKEFELYLELTNTESTFKEISTDKNKYEKQQVEKKNLFDDFYIKFEDSFRGEPEEIKNRLKIYLPYIDKLNFDVDTFKSLDLGCGRGEWIELLSENNYKNIKGLDLNQVMVQHCIESGFDVVNSDLTDYLKNLENESLSLITGFHIIEHISFEKLMELFYESYRVLKKGGMIIFETPNPENIIVGSCDFYLDPTHKNPLHPKLVEFLGNINNFKDIEIKRLNGNFDVTYDDLFFNHLVSSQVDFSVIAYK